MSKLIGIVIAFILSLILVVPLIVDKTVEESINTKVNEFKVSGLNIEMGQKSGYFNSSREFTFNITDPKKFMSYGFKNLSDKRPEYKRIALLISKMENDEFGEFLKNMRFKGSIKKSNYDFSSTNVNIYLVGFSKEVTNEILKDVNGKFFLDFVNKKGLSVDLVLNSSGEIKSARFKDIQEKIDAPKEIIKLLISGLDFQAEEVNNLHNSTLKMDRLNISTSSKVKKYDNYDLTFNKIITKMKYKNEYESSGSLSIKKLGFSAAANGSINIDDLLVTSSGKLDDKKEYRLSANYSIGNINAVFVRNLISLKGLDLKFDINKFNIEHFKELSNLVTQMDIVKFDTSITKKQKEEKLSLLNLKLFNEFVKIVNYGLEAKISIDLEKFLGANVKLNKPKFVIKAKLNKNNLLMNQLQIPYILKYLDLNGNLELQKDDYENILKILAQNERNMAIHFVEFENGKAKFVLENSQGLITINKKPLR